MRYHTYYEMLLLVYIGACWDIHLSPSFTLNLSVIVLRKCLFVNSYIKYRNNIDKVTVFCNLTAMVLFNQCSKVPATKIAGIELENSNATVK